MRSASWTAMSTSSAPNCLMQAWHAHASGLRGWLRHRMHDQAEADDLPQDIFIKAMWQGERFCSIGNTRGLVRSCRASIAQCGWLHHPARMV